MLHFIQFGYLVFHITEIILQNSATDTIFCLSESKWLKYSLNFVCSGNLYSQKNDRKYYIYESRHLANSRHVCYDADALSWFKAAK